MRRSRAVAAGVIGSVAWALTAGGCIIAEPPTDPPRLPQMRPTIVRGSVVPPASAVLGRFPERFIVPVELSDPTLTFQYSAFVDFNPATGEGLDLVGASQFEPSNTERRIRTLEIPIQEPSSDRCHVIEVIVALQLRGEDGISAHSPREPGGDSVTWFYNPSGDLGGCPTLDAGIDAAPPDAGADADAEGGVQ